MSINFDNTASGTLIFAGVPIPLDHGMAEITDITQNFVSHAEDKKPFQWNALSGAASAVGSEIVSSMTPNTVMIRPLFSGLTVNIKIAPTFYQRYFSVLNSLISYLYGQSAALLGHVSFYGAGFFIIDGYLESSSMKQSKDQDSIDWNLTLKSQPLSLISSAIQSVSVISSVVGSLK